MRADATRTVEVDTPEQVVLAFELADLGSRFLALALDGAILSVVLAGLASAAWWTMRVLDLPDALTSLGASVLLLIVFAVVWGYFFWFEAFGEGRTPGKKRAGIRVVHDGGYPLTVRGAAVRNLVRALDFQPVLTCLVGGGAMMLHPRTKRLGDMAAGTLVVRDRSDRGIPEEGMLRDADAGPPRLSDEEFGALDRYVARRGGLEEGARTRLSARLVDALGTHLAAGGPSGGTTADDRLADLHAEETRRRGAAGGPGRGSRQAAALVGSHRERWEEYEALVRAARRRGLSALPEADVSRFAELYRLVAADLARVRTYGGSGELAWALERRVAEGHNLFYRPAERSWARLGDWLAWGFPAQVRRHRGLVAAAAAALFVPALATWAVVRDDPAAARFLVPPEMVERAELAPGRLARGEGYVDPPGVFMPVMSSGLIANNVRVTFLVFAGGMLAGAGGLLILALNGVHLGAVVGLYEANRASALLWTFVAPHGVLELTAVCVAGAAGLWMGSALLVPGRRTRIDALTDRARDAVSLLAGTTLMLVLAGLVEGFVSPAPAPAALKLTVAAALAVAAAAWLGLAGRGREGTRRLRSDPGTSPPGTG